MLTNYPHEPRAEARGVMCLRRFLKHTRELLSPVHALAAQNFGHEILTMVLRRNFL